MSEKIEKLKREVLVWLGFPADIIDDQLIEQVEECEGRDGMKYLWYLDGDGVEACMRIDTEEYIDSAEILELLGCPDE